MSAPSLTEFLLARYTEGETRPHDYWCSQTQYGLPCDCRMARLNAECEAKRRIVEEHERNRTALMRECDLFSWEARVLALPYSDHPDYRQEWKP